MKSLMLFLRCFLEDLGGICGVSTTRDYETVARRVEQEGLSFLTITLPTVGLALERGLADSVFSSQLLPAFKTGRGSLPLFLGGFFERIFDSKSGVLLDEPSIEAIYAIRQISYLLKRVDLMCTDERVRRTYAKYVQCDREVAIAQAQLDPALRRDFQIMASRLFGDMLNHISGILDQDGLLPKHSTGATADRLTPNGRYRLPTWTERLESLFPSLEYCYPSYGWYSSSEYNVQPLLSPEHEPPVRVICVPKTLKAPRIIAMEPAHMMYVQQGFLEIFQHSMGQFTNALNFVNFDHQWPNQKLARYGSETGLLATLDLSDASDRVSIQHVEDLLMQTPRLRDAVLACRSLKADVPGHGVMPLAKFASMGSALCFPMEAMVFATIVFVGIARARNTPVTRLNLQRFYGKVRIYGDDIIVPTRDAEVVRDILHAFGMKVNANKSFWTGKFRESCGKDYYASYDVSVVKMKHLVPTARRDVDGIVSIVAFRNNLALSGWDFGSAIRFLDAQIERLIPFPFVTPESKILGRIDSSQVCPERVDVNLQEPLVRGAWKLAKPPSDELEGHGALMKYFLKRSDKPSEDPLHLSFAGRDRFAKIKIGWGRP